MDSRRPQTGLFCATALALGILTVITVHAQPGSVAWVQRYGNTAPTNSDARSIAVDADGNVIVAGNIFGRTRDVDWLIVKYSNAGEQLWVNFYDGPGDAWDEVTAVAVDTHGNVFVTGFSDGLGIYCNDCYPSLDYTTIAYSSAGVPLWTNRYGGPDQWESDDEAVAIAVDSNGDVVVTGSSARYAYLDDWVTIKYSGTGAPLWTNRFNRANSAASPSAVAVDSNGNVFVTGYSIQSGSSYRYTTMKYSGAGVSLWTNYYGGMTNGFDSANAVAVDTNGNVFVTGYSYEGSNVYSCVTIAYANDGVPLWTNRYLLSGTGFSVSGRALAVDRDRNVIAAGGSTGTNGQPDYLTLAYSNVGVPLWTNRYHGPNASVQSIATGLAVDTSGNVFVTGYAWGNIFDFVTIAYSAAGVPLWTNRYDGSGHNYDIPSSVAVDGSGNVFVAGYSTRSGGGYDATTIKYAGAIVPLRLTAAEKLGNDLRLSFTSRAGHHYNVQARTNLVSGEWINVVTNIPGGGALTQTTATNALVEPQQFYRIQQSP